MSNPNSTAGTGRTNTIDLIWLNLFQRVRVEKLRKFVVCDIYLFFRSLVFHFFFVFCADEVLRARMTRSVTIFCQKHTNDDDGDGDGDVDDIDDDDDDHVRSAWAVATVATAQVRVLHTHREFEIIIIIKRYTTLG